MIKIVLALFALSFSALAYVPTVESLFRHGSNEDVSVNGISLSLKVKRLDVAHKGDAALLKGKEEDFYKLFFTRVTPEVMKVAQTRYSDASFSEGSLIQKTYYPNFTPYTLKGPEQIEKGLFLGVLKSILFNNGSFLVNYLKNQGVGVRLNSELINREKIEYLAAYKHYLVTINKDRSARKSEVNPLRPEDPVARDRVEKIMNESMYVDTQEARLSREDGDMAWLISSGAFEAIVSYKEREIKKIRFKTNQGELEFVFKDYWLANGTHSVPKHILVRDLAGEGFMIEVSNLRHYVDREDDIANRHKKWDALLRGKSSLDPRPAFLL